MEPKPHLNISRVKLVFAGLFVLGVSISATFCIGDYFKSEANILATTSVRGWPWFEDPYFNIKFQYPNGWKVEKVDVTNYLEDPDRNLAGESAAVTGPDKVKSYVIRIEPPYEDLQVINRGSLDTVRSAIVIEQPGRVHGNNHFYSAVLRPDEREFESVLDPYDPDFRFNLTSHIQLLDPAARTFISFGHSRDNVISGITAVKYFPNRYNFQAYLTMTASLGYTEEGIAYFLQVIDSMQTLFPAQVYSESTYRKPVLPSDLQPNNI
jgi:hypothetical protein